MLDIDNELLGEKIKLDFSYFVVNHAEQINLSLKVIHEENFSIPQGLIVTKQSQNSITYDIGNLRYNNYDDDVFTRYNYKENTAKLYYKSINLAHEVLYLLILSRSGKYLDQRGLHRVHAAGFVIKDQNIILMLPSKGGKTTTMIELAKNEELKFISDDSPLIDSWGKVYPFPLRLGIEDKTKLLKNHSYLSEEDFYEFERRFFSKKNLIPLTKFKNKIGTGKQNILLHGVRSTYKETKIKKISKWKMLKILNEYLIIGIGLPVILEYFIQNTLVDHIGNINILMKRIFAAMNLILRSECYEVILSNDSVESVKKIREYYEQR